MKHAHSALVAGALVITLGSTIPAQSQTLLDRGRYLVEGPAACGNTPAFTGSSSEFFVMAATSRAMP